jgi:hypothetical protein
MSDESNTSHGDDRAAACGPAAQANNGAGDGAGCNPQITDGVTQSSVHTLGLGPATAAVNAYLGQAQSQTILFANMVNQQAQYANIAATSLTQELTQLFNLGNQH